MQEIPCPLPQHQVGRQEKKGIAHEEVPGPRAAHSHEGQSKRIGAKRQYGKGIVEKPQQEAEPGTPPDVHLPRRHEESHNEEIRRALTETQAYMETEMQEDQ